MTPALDRPLSRWVRTPAGDRPCVVEALVDDDMHRIVLRLDGGQGLVVESDEDFEAALLDLWQQLDTYGLKLGIARFRKNAVVSGMSRGMSDGLSCHLKRRFLPVRSKHVVGSLDQADLDAVITSAEHAVSVGRKTGRDSSE